MSGWERICKGPRAGLQTWVTGGTAALHVNAKTTTLPTANDKILNFQGKKRCTRQYRFLLRRDGTNTTPTNGHILLSQLYLHLGTTTKKQHRC